MAAVVVGLWCVAGFVGVAVLGAATARVAVGAAATYGAALMVAVFGCLAGLFALIGGAQSEVLTLPFGVALSAPQVRLDRLSGFFLLVVNLSAAACSLYALGARQSDADPLRVLPFYGLFLAAMNLVVLAADGYTLLFAWELSAVASWAIVIARDRDPSNSRAGHVYLLMAAAGGLCLIAALALLGDGGLTYDAIRQRADASPLGVLAVLLALAGAGSKAGLFPLHIWLPLAHPATPSHVSALLSGAMTKVAVYVFVRVAFDLAGTSNPYVGLFVFTLGGVTAVMGVLYATMQGDLKRLLAYSTVENIGVVFIGLGLALAFRAAGMNAAAALALTAALLHVFNHAVIKTLLFLGVGAAVRATGESSIDRLGGLVHRMPATSVMVLVGCVAVSALPPLNGFVSEWLTFQAMLASLELPQLSLKLAVPAVGAMLALSTALAAACFVKMFGLAFLSRPRSLGVAQSTETDMPGLVAMGMLAAVCVLAGVAPGFVIDALQPVAGALVGSPMPHQPAVWMGIAPLFENRSAYNALAIVLMLVALGGGVVLTVRMVAPRGVRRVDAWDGGYHSNLPNTQFGHGGFAMPLRRIFAGSLLGVRERIGFRAPTDMRPAAFSVRVLDPVWRWGYGPLVRAVGHAAVWAAPLQFQSIRRCLMMTFGGLVVLLLAVAAWR